MSYLNDVFEKFLTEHLGTVEFTPEVLGYMKHTFHAGIVSTMNVSIPIIQQLQQEITDSKKSNQDKKKSEIPDKIIEQIKKEHPEIEAENIQILSSDTAIDMIEKFVKIIKGEESKATFMKIMNESKEYSDKHFRTENEQNDFTANSAKIYDFKPNIH